MMVQDNYCEVINQVYWGNKIRSIGIVSNYLNICRFRGLKKWVYEVI